MVAMMAALTAASIVTFEYLRWSNSRQKPRPVLAATTTTQAIHSDQRDESGRECEIAIPVDQSVAKATAETHSDKHNESSQEPRAEVSTDPPTIETTASPSEAPCNCDQCKQSSQKSQPDISANRPSMVFRNKEDRTMLSAYLIKSKFYVHCSCDDHTKELYFNWPYSCSNQHREDDVVVEPGSRPTLIYEYKVRPYEGLSLANRTMEYFTRSGEIMDPKQLEALTQWRQSHERTRVLEMLAKPDIRSKEADHLTTWLVTQLNEIFFFGALKNLDTAWNTEELDGTSSTLGDSEVKLDNGDDRAIIRLHPTRRCYMRSEYTRQGKTLAGERMGSILHEMLHVFMFQFVCCWCISPENRVSHGRIWQRIAKKIEEQSLGLLGIEVDLSRFTSFLVGWESYEGLKVSLCDLEDWGFWERVKEWVYNF
jgi:hypothetical protein